MASTKSLMNLVGSVLLLICLLVNLTSGGSLNNRRQSRTVDSILPSEYRDQNSRISTDGVDPTYMTSFDRVGDSYTEEEVEQFIISEMERCAEAEYYALNPSCKVFDEGLGVDDYVLKPTQAHHLNHQSRSLENSQPPIVDSKRRLRFVKKRPSSPFNSQLSPFEDLGNEENYDDSDDDSNAETALYRREDRAPRLRFIKRDASQAERQRENALVASTSVTSEAKGNNQSGQGRSRKRRSISGMTSSLGLSRGKRRFSFNNDIQLLTNMVMAREKERFLARRAKLRAILLKLG